MRRTRWLASVCLAGVMGCGLVNGDGSGGTVVAPPDNTDPESQASEVVLSQVVTGQIGPCQYMLKKAIVDPLTGELSTGYTAVGGSITFQLTVAFSETIPHSTECWHSIDGDTEGLTLVDHLPSGLQIVSVESNNEPTSPDKSCLLDSTHPTDDDCAIAPDGQSLNWKVHWKTPKNPPLTLTITANVACHCTNALPWGLSVLAQGAQFNLVANGDIKLLHTDVEGPVGAWGSVWTEASGINLLAPVPLDGLWYGGHWWANNTQVWKDVQSAVDDSTETLEDTYTWVSGVTIFDGTSELPIEVEQANFDVGFGMVWDAAGNLQEDILMSQAASTDEVTCFRELDRIVCDASALAGAPVLYFLIEGVLFDDPAPHEILVLLADLNDVDPYPTMQFRVTPDSDGVFEATSLGIIVRKNDVTQQQETEPAEAAAKMLWIFDGVSELVIRDTGWWGTIFALGASPDYPGARIVATDSLFRGQIFARSFVGETMGPDGLMDWATAQINWVPFTGEWPSLDGALQCANSANMADDPAAVATVVFVEEPGTPLACVNDHVIVDSIACSADADCDHFCQETCDGCEIVNTNCSDCGCCLCECLNCEPEPPVCEQECVAGQQGEELCKGYCQDTCGDDCGNFTSECDATSSCCECDCSGCIPTTPECTPGNLSDCAGFCGCKVCSVSCEGPYSDGSYHCECHM